MTTDLLGQHQFERAGELIRRSVAADAAPNPLGHIEFSERLAQDARRRATRRRAGVATAALAPFVGVGVALAIVQSRVLTYRVDGSSEAGVVGSYMSASAQAPLAIRFSEGSRVTLQPRARGRVSHTDRHGATMVLEDGWAHADIVHRDGTDWQVYAGPFVVNVTGTTFDVAFDVATQTFQLKMQSGAVRVVGPGLKQPVEVHGSQQLVLSTKGPTDSAEPAAEPAAQSAAEPAAQSAVAATDSIEPGNPAQPATQERAPAASTPQCNSSAGSESLAMRHSVPALQRPARGEDNEIESLSQLGARGQHQKIVELAEKRGYDSIIASANRADLLALGNAARYAGRTNLATMAYRAVRDRFGRTSDSAAAAFYLGRMQESTNRSQAISWYERYASEAPSGAWVAEALGRRMALLSQLQAGQAAQTAAKEYLERFPTGPYAGFARKLLAP